MREFLLRLSARERALVLAAGGLFVGALVFSFLLLPAWEEGSRLKGAAVRKEAEVARFSLLVAEYRELSARAKKAEDLLAAGEGTSLLTQVETVARDSGVKDRIASMKPQRVQLPSKMWEASVEVRLEKIDLREAVEVLRRLTGSSRPVRVKRLHLKTRFDDPRLLDATFLVSAMEGAPA